MTKLAILGQGAMGSRMAVNLLDAGHAVTVWNRTPAACDALAERGATVASSPREAVEEADVVLSVVRDDEASEAVWLSAPDGAVSGLRAGALAIESSTLTPGYVARLWREVEGVGARFLDAPVVGSRMQAEARQLVHLVGGQPDVLEAARPVLRDLGQAAHHVGGVGDGARLKLVVNALLAIQVAAMAESIGALRRYGIAPEPAMTVVAGLPICSPAAKLAVQAMLAGAFSPQFPVALVEKDLAYALAAAPSGNAALPLTRAAHRVFAAAAERGLGSLNLTAVAKLYAADMPTPVASRQTS